jgi:serine/threonine protein kinase
VGVAYRDIKPSNLMMTADRRIKPCDFGLAQPESWQLTQAGTTLGTPGYMSPKKIRGRRPTGVKPVFSRRANPNSRSPTCSMHLKRRSCLQKSVTIVIFIHQNIL